MEPRPSKPQPRAGPCVGQQAGTGHSKPDFTETEALPGLVGPCVHVCVHTNVLKEWILHPPVCTERPSFCVFVHVRVLGVCVQVSARVFLLCVCVCAQLHLPLVP